MDAGQSPARSGSVPETSACTRLRRRCRRSASVPVSTARPSRMIVTRSASCSTSLRMWLDSSTVVPCGLVLGQALVEDLLHERVEAGGGLVQDEQVGRGGERGDQGDLLPVALGVGPALLGRVELEPLEQRRRAGPGRGGPRASAAAGRSSRLRSGSATGSRRRGRRRPGGGSPPPRSTGPARRRWPGRRWCGAARAGCGWSWTCRRRWVPGSRAPPPRPPAGRARRGPRRCRTA